MAATAMMHEPSLPSPLHGGDKETKVEASEMVPEKVDAHCVDRPAEIKARVSKALEKTDPVNLMATVRKVASPPPASWQDMQLIVHAVCDTAMDGPVDPDENVPGSLHSRTSETYADIIFHLRMHFPQFEVPNDKPMTFTRILLNVVQDEFEAMTPHGVPVTGTGRIDEETKKRQINLCSLIGNFFVRKLLAAKVMAQVVHDLIGVRDRQPEDHFILYGAELLQVIGKCLDVSGQGNMLMTQFLARLSNLAGSQRQDTREARYPQEIRNVVKAVHESRFRKWPARAGTQVLVKLEFLEAEDVAPTRQRLLDLGFGSSKEREEGAGAGGYARTAGEAPKAGEETDKATGADAEQFPKPMKVVVATSGRECGVLDDVDLARTDLEAPVKEAISRWTGVHPNRIIVLHPDGDTILQNS